MKRSAGDMYGEGGKTGGGEEDEVTGSGGESQMSGLLMANKLLYHFPHDFSVIVNATKKESLFNQRQYRDGETMMCTIMTGADYVDPLRSYISMDVDAKLTGFGKWWEHSRVGFGANNTACNFIRSIVVKSRSGDEIMRTNNFNVLAAHRMLYVYNAAWWKSVGSTMTRVLDTACDTQTLDSLGRTCQDATWRAKLENASTAAGRANLESRTTEKTWVTGTHRVNIPLYCLGGIFATDKLLPANLMSGLVVQITLADARDVFVWHAPKNITPGTQSFDIAQTIPIAAHTWHQAEEDIADIGLLTGAANITKIGFLPAHRDASEIGVGDDFKGFGSAQIGFGIAVAGQSLRSDNAGRCTNLSSQLAVGDIIIVREQAAAGNSTVTLVAEITGFGAATDPFDPASGKTYKGFATVKPVHHAVRGVTAADSGHTEVTLVGRAANANLGTGTAQVTVIRQHKVRTHAVGATTHFGAGNTGATACEKRQMKDALTRNELIALNSWGFDSEGKPHYSSDTDGNVRNKLSTVFQAGQKFETQYNVYVPRVICHCNQLTDAAQRAINATSAHNGLEIVYYDFENTQAPAEKEEMHVEVKKAVSRAMKAIAVIRPTDTSATNVSTAVKVHTNTFAAQPWNVKDYQWQLGALYFPHQRIEGKGSDPDGLAYTAAMAYYEALDCFSGFAPKRNYANVEYDEFTGLATDQSSKTYLGTTGDLGFAQLGSGLATASSSLARKVTHQDPGYRCNGVIAQSLERSGIFELSGLPINNSRVLVLHAAFDPSSTTDADAQLRNVDIFLKYVKVARVFMQMVEVES